MLRAIDRGSVFQLFPGPQQPWKGSNAPSSCRNGKRSGFSCCAAFVWFYFCFVTWETLGNGLHLSQLRSPGAGGGPSSSMQSSALWCTGTAVAWSSAEPRDINRGEKLKAHIWHAASFPRTVCHVVQFWWERCLSRTEDSAVWIQPKQ